MKVRFLGTSSAIPTNDRGLPSILIKTLGDSILLDCGEGTQRQMIKAGESLMKIQNVVITHLHGDHFFGLLPLIQTLGILRKSSELHIIGPSDLEDIIRRIENVTGSRHQFKISFDEIKISKIFSLNKFLLEFFPVNHAGFETYGVKIREKEKPGRFDPEKADKLGVPPILRGVLQKGYSVKLPNGRIVKPQEVMGPPREGPVLVYSSDTRPVESVINKASGADMLIHEATYLNELKDRAIMTGHSTALEAGEVAKAANVKMLVLTHFSARYREEDLAKFKEEASKAFDGEIIVAKDFMTINL